MIEFYMRPAHFETILAHLTGLTAHRVLKGDEDQGTVILGDYSRRLTELNATELHVFEACEHFIENDDGDFFPTFAKLKKKVFESCEAPPKHNPPSHNFGYHN